MDRRIHELIQFRAECRIVAHDAIERAVIKIPGWAHDRTGAYSRDRLLRRDMVLLQLVGIECDNDCPLIAAKRWGSGDPGQCRKQRPHLIEGEVLKFALGVVGTREEKQANSDASGIEAGNEWRYSPWRHEGPSSRDITDGLRHRLLHVGTFTKTQLHQRSALDALAID